MTDFSPREIVSELDRFIIGKGRDARRAVAKVDTTPSSIALLMVRDA